MKYIQLEVSDTKKLFSKQLTKFMNVTNEWEKILDLYYCHYVLLLVNIYIYAKYVN